MRHAAVGIAVLVSVLASAHARTLTLEERIAAHRAVQRVYHAHQLGNLTTFEEAIPSSATERLVRTELMETAALTERWGVTVSDERLAREVRRILRDSKDPARLREIRAALNDDPFLFAEIVARPVLVRALARGAFRFDPTIHAGARGRAERLERELRSGAIDPTKPFEGRIAREVERSKDEQEFQRWRERLGNAPGSVGHVEEMGNAFAVRVLLDQSPDRIRLATYTIPKISWDTWWSSVEGSFEPRDASIAGPASIEAASSTESDFACIGDDTWAAGALEGVGERSRHSLVWTGTEMLVWGGERDDGEDYTTLEQGLRYDPATDTWSLMTREGAPSPRAFHTAVWTGREMLVWGSGAPGFAGGRYDPALDRWTPMTTVGAPQPRVRHVAVWTGREMIVWGGAGYATGTDLADGGRYDPDLDRWTPLATTNAPPGRADATAVWTGQRMLVWGGHAGIDDVPLGSGGRYDPGTNTWEAIATTGAPSPRWGHTAVWDGTRMIVWGGSSTLTTTFNDGARYDPVTNQWAPIQTAGAPTDQAGHSAAWSGEYMVIWGGRRGSGGSTSGGRYRPSSDTWLGMATTGAPSIPAFHRSIWTGTEMIVWGGGDNSSPQRNDGGRYDPVTDQWRPTSRGSGPPPASNPVTVWTGTEMIAWGGRDVDGGVLYPREGGRFDPALDAWIPMTDVGAPEGRVGHTAIWSGSRMVAWGGEGAALYGNGARYDPLTDTWTPTTATGAPTARRDHTVVWTGTSMIVWGGSAPGVEFGTGGRYDPNADQWQTISTVNAPAARSDHSATWAGSSMIVWGGRGTNLPLSTGGRYNPATDAWAPTSITNAPAARFAHGASWAGNRLVVWGGIDATSLFGLDTGGRYDPATNTWTATSLTGVPAGRYSHTTVSTGIEMIVWGGDQLWNAFGLELMSGGRYNPTTDTWRPTATENAPRARDAHAAVWTGNAMLIWSGFYNPLSTGGTYVVGPSDADADGIADACDCAASDAGATAVPTEATVLRFASDKTALTWYASTGGTGTAHDVVRGTLANLPVGSGGESCLASGLTEARLDDPTSPASGGWWYLVRGRNACGPGTYGEATGGTRVTATCP
jgi:N-acetylneuraminic acid mutarotase